MSLKKKTKTPRNKFELETFKFLKKKKVKFEYESQKIAYYYTGHYIPDFPLRTASGSFIYIEDKGYFRPEDKRKLAAVKKCNPTLDIRILFYSHKERDVRWAKKLGFPYAIRHIPQEWLDDLKR